MAEALGVIASGISVVSLAIQIAECVQKLRNFCSLMRDAPRDVLMVNNVLILVLLQPDMHLTASFNFTVAHPFELPLV